MVKEDTSLTSWHWELVSWKIIFPPPRTREWRGWFGDDSRALHLLCTLCLLLFHQLHLRSSGIRARRTSALCEGKAQSKTRGCSVRNPIFPHLSFWDPRRKDVNLENLWRGLSALPDMSLTIDVIYLYANVMYICKCVLNGSLRGVGGQSHLSWGLWRRQIFMLIMRYLICSSRNFWNAFPFFKKIFIWPHWGLLAVHGIFRCQLLCSCGSRAPEHTGSVVVVPGLSCFMACGI